MFRDLQCTKKISFVYDTLLETELQIVNVGSIFITNKINLWLKH